MLDSRYFEDIGKKIYDKLPKGMINAKDDMEKTIHSILHTTLSKLDLVTREEFDMQVKLLDKLRKRVTALEQEVNQLTPSKKSLSI